jgi:hypothetical protein
MTGIVTDIGIELGKLFYWNGLRNTTDSKVLADRQKLRLLIALIGLFFLGGLLGALSFKHVGFLFFLPLAALLLILVGVPTVDHLRRVQAH